MTLSSLARSGNLARRAAAFAAVLAAGFLFLLVLLHFLKPELDPAWRMISEYELGRFGWLMSLAFFCWGLSVLALALALWNDLRTTGGKIGRWWLALLSIFLFGAGIFVTQPITEPASTTAHYLHSLCGAVVIMTFPIAATLVAVSLRKNPDWQGGRGGVLWLTVLLWLGMAAFFAAIPVSNVINPGAGRNGPLVYIGWPNRAMVAAYLAWIIYVGLKAARLQRSTAGAVSSQQSATTQSSKI